MWIDTHCHINCLSQDQIEKLVPEAGGHLFIDSSTHLASATTSLSLSQKYPFVYSALGFHPFWAEEFFPEIVEKYEALIDSASKVVAIGEVGLDFKADAALDTQKEILKAFIVLAQKKGLALIVHNRLEAAHILDVLGGFFSSYEKVIFHCFSYSEQILRKIVEKKGFISFSLNILRKKDELLMALEACPLEHMLLETDAPYMRIGKRESLPSDIREVYSFVAKTKGIDEENLQNIIFSNAQRAFPLITSR
ncbi:MAG: TatD family hydrolase [Candidatus Omnitrophota bacterium]|nr:MAG: TatD family hydrolase [Candidatus Omnitrophota bacterium]